MGTKYSSNAASGYNTSPPADDGTVSEANKGKWSTIKTKLADPVKDLADTINSELVTHFDVGPQAYTSNQTLGASHYGQFIQGSGSGTTLTLSDAATLGAGWHCFIRNVDSSNNITLARATGGDTINGSAANYTISPGESFTVFVNAAGSGFFTVGLTLAGNNTLSGYNNFTGTTGFTAGFGNGHVNNLSLTASVGSNAMTIALKTRAGADATSTTPIEIAFGSATAATGDYTVRQVTAANSLVISSGSTLGTTSAQANRIWIVAFDDAGTIRLGAINCSTSTNIYALSDDSLASSTAEGGAGAADSAGVFYTGTAVTTKPYRVLGYVESTQATAGTWATSPSRIRLWTPGMKLPGDVVQRVVSVDAAVATGTTTLPYDDTIPQNTEGDQYMSQAITPTNGANVLKITHVGNYTSTVGDVMTAALFQDTTANALTASRMYISGGQLGGSINLYYQFIANTASSTTFKIRAGDNSAGTTTFNGVTAGRKYGGIFHSTLLVEELMG